MNLRTAIDESKLPALTHEQLDILRRYALFEAKLADVRRALAEVWNVEFSPLHRTASTHFRIPEPGIVITREHISNALERRRFDLISERDLAEWATVLLLNDAYALDPGDEDLIADWLNDISLNLGPG
jgi:hypothetical protein